ncbi:hypothetical protein FQA39_LY07965 [Lamprigera yunnana]|nr:hypothetical protein FQA39_LY07965 [Lamprigera yunnana]
MLEYTDYRGTELNTHHRLVIARIKSQEDRKTENQKYNRIRIERLKEKNKQNTGQIYGKNEATVCVATASEADKTIGKGSGKCVGTL